MRQISSDVDKAVGFSEQWHAKSRRYLAWRTGGMMGSSGCPPGLKSGRHLLYSRCEAGVLYVRSQTQGMKNIAPGPWLFG